MNKNKVLDGGKTQNTRRPGFVVTAIVIISVVAVSLIILAGKEKFKPVIPGEKAPLFTLPDLSGARLNLSNYSGKVVFVNFWATWCKPCEAEMPSMEYLYNRLKGKGFEMLAVSIDSKGTGVVRQFVRKFKLTFPVLHDRSGQVRDTYKTTGVPETFIVDQNGIIAEKIWGPRDWSLPESSKVIYELINKGPQIPDNYPLKEFDK